MSTAALVAMPWATPFAMPWATPLAMPWASSLAMPFAVAVAAAIAVLLPVLGGALSFVWPNLGRRLGLVVSAVLIVNAGFAARECWLHGETLLHAVGGHTAPLGITLRLDGLAGMMLVLVGTVAFFITLHAQESLSSRPRQGRLFWPLWLFLIAALNALFLSGDLFNLYVTLEALGFAALALVALADNPAARRAALRYLFVSLLGSLLYLIGVGLTYSVTSTVDLLLVREALERGAAREPIALALALMTAGLLMKAALFPLHFWLPTAHANAPAPVSAALSGLVIKGSIFVLLRLFLTSFTPRVDESATTLLGSLGAMAVIWGSLRALTQDRLKLWIAYSTVAQVGYIFLLFPLYRVDPKSALAGGLVFLVAHALAKSAIFLAAGNIVQAIGHDEIRGLEGITHHLPLSMAGFAIATVSLVGLPPTAGFLGKWFLIRAAISGGQWWWVAVITIGTVLGAAYVLKVMSRAFAQRPDSSLAIDASFADWKVVSPVMEWSSLSLAILAVVVAGFASPITDLVLQSTMGLEQTLMTVVEDAP